MISVIITLVLKHCLHHLLQFVVYFFLGGLVELMVHYTHVYFIGRERRCRGQPAASNQLQHFLENLSTMTQMNYIKKRKFKPKFTWTTWRLVSKLCVCGCICRRVQRIIPLHILAFAEAFLWVVFSVAGQEDTYGQSDGPVWLEEAAESVARVASSGVGRTKAAGGGEYRGGATSR